MIRTTHQLTVTKEKLGKLQAALEELRKTKDSRKASMQRLKENGLLSLIEELQEEIDEFEQLSTTLSARFDCPISGYPELLIKARLIKRMSQTELGKKIGVDAQQIQRYESNGYAGVGFERLQEIQYALDMEVECSTQIIKDKKIFILPEGSDEEELKEMERFLQESNCLMAVKRA